MSLTVGDQNLDTPDAGCELASRCLECPFDRCLQEDPLGRQRYHMEQRDALIRAMRHGGKGSREIAVALGLSRRTVQRSLARGRGK